MAGERTAVLSYFDRVMKMEEDVGGFGRLHNSHCETLPASDIYAAQLTLSPFPHLYGVPTMTIPITPEALDAAIEAESFTGVLTVDVGDERTLERCEGFANRALGVPNTPSTRISAASGNKGFTALVIMRLVEDGKLGLKDLVRPILGDDLPLIDDAVTIEHLLTHTSGIGDYLDEEGDGEIDDYIFSLPLHALAETEAFLPALDGFPQKFPPGERFSYCNGGYVVLALVAERVSGRDFHELVQTEVCDRAGLDRLRISPLRRPPRGCRARLLGRGGQPHQRAAPPGAGQRRRRDVLHRRRPAPVLERIAGRPDRVA